MWIPVSPAQLPACHPRNRPSHDCALSSDSALGTWPRLEPAASAGLWRKGCFGLESQGAPGQERQTRAPLLPEDHYLSPEEMPPGFTILASSLPSPMTVWIHPQPASPQDFCSWFSLFLLTRFWHHPSCLQNPLPTLCTPGLPGPRPSCPVFTLSGNRCPWGQPE